MRIANPQRACVKYAKLLDVCDYIILQVTEAEESLNSLKLHKLLYYVQAWHLAFYGEPLFEGKFQAWIHGPVNKEIYRRFNKRSLYDEIEQEDISEDFDLAKIDPKAREGYRPTQRCEAFIDEQLMANYYADRLKQA